MTIPRYINELRDGGFIVPDGATYVLTKTGTRTVIELRLVPTEEKG